MTIKDLIVDLTVRYGFQVFGALVVGALAAVVALDKFGFQIAPLVAGIGVAGLGVGQLTLAVRYGSNLSPAPRTAREVVTANPRVLKDPAPLVGIAEVSALGIKIDLRPWVPVSDFAVAGAELYQELIERFRARRVGVPSRQHEVRLLGESARRVG